VNLDSLLVNSNKIPPERIKVKVTLELAMKTQRRSRDIALLFFNLGVRWSGWSTPRPGRFNPGKDPVPIV
jgi:hypothetical protein